MSNDRELLELAAKAARVEVLRWNSGQEPYSSGEGFILPNLRIWNPLTDDGDALRLAVNLGIHIEQNTAFKRACALWYGKSVLREELFVFWGDDKYAATRRAIVLAAVKLSSGV